MSYEHEVFLALCSGITPACAWEPFILLRIQRRLSLFKTSTLTCLLSTSTYEYLLVRQVRQVLTPGSTLTDHMYPCSGNHKRC